PPPPRPSPLPYTTLFRSAACSTALDCESQLCSGGSCAAASCSDLTLNGDETDTDCGGSICTACAAGASCVVATDCSSMSCTAGRSEEQTSEIQSRENLVC